MPNWIAQPHLILIADLARDLLAEAAQSNEIARLACTLQIDLYYCSYFDWNGFGAAT